MGIVCTDSAKSREFSFSFDSAAEFLFPRSILRALFKRDRIIIYDRALI